MPHSWRWQVKTARWFVWRVMPWPTPQVQAMNFWLRRESMYTRNWLSWLVIIVRILASATGIRWQRFVYPFEQQCFSHLFVNLDIVFYGISNHCFFMVFSNHCFFMVFSNHVFFMVFLKCVKICIFVLKFVERENIIAKSVAKTVLY